jgi:apolipoprotein N-acyltransferase
LLAALTFTAVIGSILVYGTIRLSNSQSFGTAQIAAVVLLPEDGKAGSTEVFNHEKRPVPYNETLNRIEMLTAEAAFAGAEIVAFQETAMTIAEEDIDRLRADYARIAAENELWLSITYAWYADEGKGANMHLLFDDRGQIRADYQKRFLFGFGQIGETAVFSKGVERIQVVDSPYGRIAVSICRDMNFPAYARQAGKDSADIMLTPAYDFPKSTAPSDYARAVECGFSLVRPTYNGVSYAVDPYGRILARMDSEQDGSGIMYAEVPTQGVRTMYAKFGDLFAWLNVLLLSVFAVYSFSQKSLTLAAHT